MFIYLLIFISYSDGGKSDFELTVNFQNKLQKIHSQSIFARASNFATHISFFENIDISSPPSIFVNFSLNYYCKQGENQSDGVFINNNFFFCFFFLQTKETSPVLSK